MAKIQIKSEKLTPFGGIFSIMEQFDSTLSSVIDSTLGLRCRLFGYQYSEIIRPVRLKRFLSKNYYINEQGVTYGTPCSRISIFYESLTITITNNL